MKVNHEKHERHEQNASGLFLFVFFVPFVVTQHTRQNEIYKTFASTGVVTEDCQAESGAQLRQLLTEDHRFIFTLIQKFAQERPKGAPKGWRPSGPYPGLSRSWY